MEYGILTIAIDLPRDNSLRQCNYIDRQVIESPAVDEVFTKFLLSSRIEALEVVFPIILPQDVVIGTREKRTMTLLQWI